MFFLGICFMFLSARLTFLRIDRPKRCSNYDIICSRFFAKLVDWMAIKFIGCYIFDAFLQYSVFYRVCVKYKFENFLECCFWIENEIFISNKEGRDLVDICSHKFMRPCYICSCCYSKLVPEFGEICVQMLIWIQVMA